MASLSLTITSNNVGIVTSSYVISEEDLVRLINTLRSNYTEQIEQRNAQSDGFHEDINLSVFDCWNMFSESVMYNITNMVSQREIKELHDELVEKNKPIDIKLGGK